LRVRSNRPDHGPDQEFYNWLHEVFSRLPRSNEPFFRKLWQERRLKIDSSLGRPDLIDELNARLVCAALHQNVRLLLVLPDSSPHRPPLLFSTGLIMHALDVMDRSRLRSERERATFERHHGTHAIGSRLVLYFGSTVGIRQHLAQVNASETNLAAVFPQVHRTRSGSYRESRQRTEETSLPTVICVYSPVDPVAVIEQHRPDWIAIDCGEEPKLRWLSVLLEFAHARKLPVIAWCQNPLSLCIDDFIKTGALVFRWPYMQDQSFPTLSSPADDGSPLEQILNQAMNVNVKPLLVGDRSFFTHLQNAYYSLVDTSRIATGRLAQDALHVGWRYLRTLEGLHVPLDIYENEAKYHWGLKSISQLRATFGRFIQSIHQVDSSLASKLEEVSAYLDSAYDYLQDKEPPLWTALTELCVSDVPKEEFLTIVFPSPARKQVFSFALLARYNFSEEELRDLRVGFMSLTDLRTLRNRGNGQQIPSGLTLRPLLVGLLSQHQSAQVAPLLHHHKVDILIYPYQEPALVKRITQWGEALSGDLRGQVEVLAHLSKRPLPVKIPESTSHVKLTISGTIKAEEQPRRSLGVPSTPPWQQAADPVEELERLLGVDDLEEGEEALLAQRASTSGETREITEEDLEERPWLEEAIAVHFDGGWKALLSPNDTINVIITGSDGTRLEERYVRALRSGDRVLFLHDQRRQSLYDLIISRVHRHPAIEIHLALIQRWQNDFVLTYHQRWRNKGRSLEDLLEQLQNRGSRLTSTVTLRQWLRGQILCPQDPKDLHRLAEVLDIEFVRQYYQRISHAARRLAGLHRGLANRLNRWLEQQAAGIFSGTLEEIFDEELGLSLRDFRDSILILTVKSLNVERGPFLRSRLSKLERRNADE